MNNKQCDANLFLERIENVRDRFPTLKSCIQCFNRELPAYDIPDDGIRNRKDAYDYIQEYNKYLEEQELVLDENRDSVPELYEYLKREINNRKVVFKYDQHRFAKNTRDSKHKE